MTQVEINGKQYEIKCDMGILCEFQARYGTDYVEEMRKFDDVLKSPKACIELINIMTEQGVAESIESFGRCMEIATICRLEIIKFFVPDASLTPSPEEGEQEAEAHP